jgi:predicted phosphate transport protein (TIGR00153 family)
MSRVRRIENQFFDKFAELAHEVAACAETFDALVRNWPASVNDISKVKDYEVKCDAIMRETLTLLENSFITPFDREDIDRLVRELDHIADGMDNVSARFNLYDIDNMRPEALQMADLILRASKELSELFDHFENFKKDPVVREKMHTIGTIEDEGDTVSRQGLASLFRDTTDAIEVIKWKSLIDTLENTVDSCKAVANVVRSVLVKNA